MCGYGQDDRGSPRVELTYKAESTPVWCCAQYTDA